MTLSELNAEIARLRAAVALREPIPPARNIPSAGLRTYGGIRQDGEVISRDGTFDSSGFSNGGEEVTVFCLSSTGERVLQGTVSLSGLALLGDAVPGRYISLIGTSNDLRTGHFMPWVVEVESVPTTGIYPVGLTFEQLFELEWRTKELEIAASITGPDGTDSTGATVRNVYRGQDIYVPDERYGVLRAGLWQRNITLAQSLGTGRTTTLLGEVMIGKQNVTDADWIIGDTYWPPDPLIEVTETLVVPSTTIEGPRIIYFDGLYYPAMFVGGLAFTSVDEEGPHGGDVTPILTFGSAPDLFDDVDPPRPMGEPTIECTIIGHDGLWSVSFTMDSNQFAGDYSLTAGDIEIQLVPWEFA